MGSRGLTELMEVGRTYFRASHRTLLGGR